jgi:hypothetical protein
MQILIHAPTVSNYMDKDRSMDIEMQRTQVKLVLLLLFRLCCFAVVTNAASSSTHIRYVFVHDLVMLVWWCTREGRLSYSHSLNLPVVPAFVIVTMLLMLLIMLLCNCVDAQVRQLPNFSLNPRVLGLGFRV